MTADHQRERDGIARVLAAKPKPKLTYWFVFFDGEEPFCEDWDTCRIQIRLIRNKLPDNTYGSRQYVAQLIEKNEVKRVRDDPARHGGLQRPEIRPCGSLSSKWLATCLADREASRIRLSSSPTDTKASATMITPVPARGHRCARYHSTKFYPYWHTKEDTLDKISAKSLKAVGDAVVMSLPKIEERIQTSKR
jgi:hypothetical protein